MSDYEFTKDWFYWAPEMWTQFTPLLPARKSFLEIGSFEGRSAVWAAEHMLEDDGKIICIDTWEGGEEHTPEDMASTESRFDRNVALLHEKFPDRRIAKFKGTSYNLLATLAYGEAWEFDFIYIDGSHLAKDVLTDACMAFALLKPGGVMLFDDYLWDHHTDHFDRPKMSVDSFANLFINRIEVVFINYQLFAVGVSFVVEGFKSII
jgi:predicted O-methyltransferase YrrM